MHKPQIPNERLVVVTGKGGVGKTTVAAALALHHAAAGRRTIVAEVGGQSRIPALLGRPAPPPGKEAKVADSLWTISLDPVAGLAEWLGHLLPSQMAAVLARSGTFGAFVAAAPGAAELVAITKAWELGSAPRWRRAREPFDVVVLDAPASGHGIGMLLTPSTYADIARVGPIASQARKVVAGLRDHGRTGYVCVTIPTELAVTETLELETRLEDAVDQGFGLIVCNGVLPSRLDGGELARVAAADGALPHAAIRAAEAAAGRAEAQGEQLVRLHDRAAAPVVELPFRFATALGRDDVVALADVLKD
jgi:anion-transporting  ArsA/GET3 family ATPase